MKTTIGNACRAYGELIQLLRQAIPVQYSIQFFNLRNALKPTYECGCWEERRAKEDYQVSNDKDGRLVFLDKETEKAYYSKIHEIAAQKIEIDVSPIDISGLGNSVKIVLDALEDFVTF